jgi:hypothetical protein
MIAPSMEGMLSETLTLRTNDPDQPIVRVPVTAEAIELDAGPNDAWRRDASVGTADAGPDAGSRAAGLTGGACGCSVPRSDRGAPLGLIATLACVLATRRRRTSRTMR